MNEDYERWAALSDREAIGEPLSQQERDFLAAFGATDELARAESELWERLSSIPGASDEAADVAAADRAVAAFQSARLRGSRGRGRVVWAVFGGLAAAAAVALVIRANHTASSGLATSVVEFVGAEAFADGVRVEKGAHLAPGTELVAGSAPVCVAVEPKIHTCLASGAKVRLSQAFTAERRVDVLAGRAAFALAPLPKGEHFAVVADGISSTAVGTAFTVELDAALHAVRTTVHEGKVRVAGPSQEGSLVSAHKIGLAKAGEVSVEPLGDHRSTETPEWVAMSQVAGRSIEGEMPPVAEAPSLPPPEVASPESTTLAPQAGPDRARPAAKATEEPATAGDLLAKARQSLRDQRWVDAAGAYQKLVSTYPNTPEARTAIVPLAKLEVDRLGQPALALPGLESYIKTGGSLVVEARLARIRALRSLGRTADEARAIDEFLAAHPNSLEADGLRERLATLRK